MQVRPARQDASAFRLSSNRPKQSDSSPSSPVIIRSAMKKKLATGTSKGTREMTIQCLPPSIERIQEMVHPELVPSEGSSILSGEEHLFIPPALEGCNILVLGCKSGLESYVCSALVGPNGHVTGVDSNGEEIEKANQFLEYHTRLFRHKTSNTKFIQTPLSDLSQIESDSIDVVISACSLNTQEEKLNLFKECYRVLRQGGEIYFSDVLSNKRQSVSDSDRETTMYNTIYKEDFRRLMNKAGFDDVRMMSREDLTDSFISSVDSSGKSTRFYLITVRAFKVDSPDDRREAYGQKATYLGTPTQSLHIPFCLDDESVFHVGRAMEIDGNTAEILSKTRYKKLFEVTPRGLHEGLFVSIRSQH